MCIRDRSYIGSIEGQTLALALAGPLAGSFAGNIDAMANSCLLYTSDAADERSSVDLGGRRIIKKKTTSYSDELCGITSTDSQHNHHTGR